ncbi:hypothetical protein [Paenibacillus sp. MBLB4367]|uniref:hypothetical protein n=1 Tax=Paenibacillus sp. MBLB4367 TaxID=3384767 RepID=UPI0039081113
MSFLRKLSIRSQLLILAVSTIGGVQFVIYQKLNSFIINQKNLMEGILDIVISGENGTWIDLQDVQGDFALRESSFS